MSETVKVKKTLADYPNLVKEFDYSKNNGIKPEDVKSKSCQKIWWICEQMKHTWKTTPNSRTRKKATNCPYCTNQFVSETNNLFVKALDISAEFDIDRNNIHPSKVHSGSHTKYYWKCLKDPLHTWYASVKQRTGGNKSSCPFCKPNKLSEEIFKICKKYNIKLESEITFKLDNKRKKFDYYLPDFCLYIELDGSYHFKKVKIFKQKLEETHQNDILKTIYCHQNKMRLLRISIHDIRYLETILLSEINDKNPFPITLSNLTHYQYLVDGMYDYLEKNNISSENQIFYYEIKPLI